MPLNHVKFKDSKTEFLCLQLKNTVDVKPPTIHIDVDDIHLLISARILGVSFMINCPNLPMLPISANTCLIPIENILYKMLPSRPGKEDPGPLTFHLAPRLNFRIQEEITDNLKP